jgi:2-C-methyl-D-erythritol 4-phosphate cytidylyltransferase
VVAVVLAAGSGSRMNGADKMMARLDGRPVLEWSLTVLDACDEIDAIQLVVPDHEDELLTRLGRAAVRQSEFRVCSGGPSRAFSALYGLRAASDGDFGWALVHDGARPFLTPDIVVRGLEAARATGAAIAAVPATDTVQISDEAGFIVESPQRRIVWMAQTPQIARLRILLDAHERLHDRLGDFTDEASVLREIGHAVAISEGSYSNVKITTADDLAMAEFTIDRLHSRQKA